MGNQLKIGFGGGCHWCTEAVFQQLNHIQKVRQGYIKSLGPYDTWSEAVLVEVWPNASLELLVDIHLQTHASTSIHSRRAEYRSAVYYMDVAQKEKLEQIMSTLSRKHNTSYITQVLPFKEFTASRESLQNYYKTRPEAPFCKRYILPKLELVSKLKLKKL